MFDKFPLILENALNTSLEFLLAPVLSYDLPVEQVHQHAYVVPSHPDPHICKITYYGVPVGAVVEVPLKHIGRLFLIARALCRPVLC